MPSATRVRPPAVAGMFYPANPRTLASTVDRLLADVGPVDTWEHRVPKAVIAPHAGYPYSGPIAAKAFATLIPAAGRIERVVLIGPSHRMWFDGIASADADRFDTPLGPVRVSAPLDPGVFPSTGAHAEEHALEVELPFIQRVLGDVEVVPLLASEAPPDAVASVLDHLWGNAGTVFVVSSDLSHYHAWDEANRLDARTAKQILGGGPDLTPDQACGATPINGLLALARARGLRADCLDLRNSGDTAGPRDRVVGYGAFAFYDAEARTP